MKLSKSQLFKALGYEPHPRQWEYHQSRARFRIACCGRRFGKTSMAARDRTIEMFKGNTRGWIVGGDYSIGEKEFRILWDDLIVNRKLNKDKSVKKKYNPRNGEMYIYLPNGSSVEVKSAMHPDKLIGESLDWVILSEAAKQKRETWERFIRPSLSDRRGTADFVTTPEGHNWIYNLWMYGHDETYPTYDSWRFPSWENIHVFPGGRQDPEILEIERSTTPEYFMQEYGADFASFLGKIYPEFDEVTHVTKQHYNPEWPNFITFDWGFSNPLAAMEFQMSPSEDIHVWREHYKAGLTTVEHCNELNMREQPEGYKIDLTFGDAADPEAAETVTQNLFYVNEHGQKVPVPCVTDKAAKDNWRRTIEVVKKYLKLRHDGVSYDEYERPNMKPKYFVDPSCINHIREMREYRTKEGYEGKVESNSTGIARKIDDHTLDAMRYGIMHVCELGYGEHLSEYAADIVATPQGRVQAAGYTTMSGLYVPGSDGFITTETRF